MFSTIGIEMAAPSSTIYRPLLLLVALATFAIGAAQDCSTIPSIEGCECEADINGIKRLTCDTRSLDIATILPQLPNEFHELKLYRGAFSVIANYSFVTLTNLKKLVIDLCDVEVVETEAFSQLVNLEELELTVNDVERLPDAVFKDLRKLKKLTLSDNLVTSLDRNTFLGLGNLQYLDLSGNKLTTIPDDLFHHLTGLNELLLNENDIASLPSTTFQSSTLLQKLYMNDNKLADLHTDTFNGTLLIKEVHMQKNKLTTLSDALFAYNYNLELIDFTNNAFICDCEMAPFRIWASTTQLQWNAEQSGICASPENLKNTFLLNVQPVDLICTTTTTTTTVPTTTTAFLVPRKSTNMTAGNPGTTAETQSMDDMTKYIIIGCSIGGAFFIAVIVGVVICCRKPRKQKPRQVKYILKPNGTDLILKSGDKPLQNGTGDAGEKLTLRPKPAGDNVDNHTFHANPQNYDGIYKPNILPVETNLDEDLRYGYDNHMYTNQPETPPTLYQVDGVNDGMQFYNSLSKSIAGASIAGVSIGREQNTPYSMLHRATPVNRTLSITPTLPSYSETHRATPASPYKMADTQPQWKEGQYYDHSSYGPNFDVGSAPADMYGAYPSYYQPENDSNGKYSTGSGDSGVHSNSPIPRTRTPTDFSDHQISLTDQYSSNKKTIKNETYV